MSPDASWGGDGPCVTPRPLLDRPIERVLSSRSGKPFAEGLGLVTVADLMNHLPRRYESFREPTPLGRLPEGEHVTVVARVKSGTARRARSGSFVVQVTVTDGRHDLQLAFFAKREYMAQHVLAQLPVGSLALFDGKVGRYNQQPQLAHPRYERLPEDATQEDAQARAEKLMPIYPASAKLPSWKIAKAVATLLPMVVSDGVPDPLPEELLVERGWPTAAEALVLIHQPTDRDEVHRARERYRFEEAFVLQVALARRRAQSAALPATPRTGRHAGLVAAFDERMPFQLTAGQVAVGQAIEADLASEHPMHRLLQGEVGSGKTVVALRAMLTVVDAGGQAALLAPTEVLAVQHHRSITAMLGGLADAGMLPLDGDDAAGATAHADVATRVALLTGSLSAPARRQALADTAGGEAGIVIGTHALLQEAVDFHDLGLVVVDEQHRFGVEQRDALRAKSLRTPHLLVMTATPIPRTVAMTVFGDLETSTLTEVPSGRQPVVTHVVPEDNPAWVERAWARVREEVDAGRQAFVVCPRIGGDGSEVDETVDVIDVLEAIERRGVVEPPARRPPRAVLDVVDELAGVPALGGLRIEVLHGRMPPDEKDAVMRRVTAGEVDVLVATTVIEVGVDVPNASVMVVMDADRFGVSQLHQLRGRIGRGAHAGVCLLVCGEDARDPARERLAQVAATNDGFELSRLDLENRREGDVLGSAQSGWRSSLRLLRVTADEDVIVDARREAAAVVAADPDLTDHRVLSRHIARLLDPEREVYLERG